MREQNNCNYCNVAALRVIFAGLIRNHLRNFSIISFGSVETGAHCSAAERELAKCGQCVLNTPDRVLNLLCVSRKLLTKCERCGVLCVSSTDFDNVLEFRCLHVQRPLQGLQAREQHSFELGDCSDVPAKCEQMA